MKKHMLESRKTGWMTCCFLLTILMLGTLTSYSTQAGNAPSASSPGLLDSVSVGPLVKLSRPRLAFQTSEQTGVYLPLLIHASTQGSPSPTPQPTPQPTPGPTPGPTATPPPPGLGNSFFLPYLFDGDAQATDGPYIVVDANNGVHIAYAAYTSDGNGKRMAYYTYCASNCTTDSQFSDPVALGDKVDHVNLGVDPAGHPRLLWFGPGLSGEPLTAIYYAECNTSCTAAGNWTVTPVVKMDTTLAHSSQFFGVDPQGHPGFVYYDDYLPHKNTFYRFCKASCTDVDNWLEVSLADALPESDRELRGLSLAFASTGEPRIAAAFTDYTANDPPTYLIYMECSTDCQTMSVGAAFDLRYCKICNDTGGYFNLQLDNFNQPRLALYTGGIQNVPPQLEANRLYYLYCNTACGDPSSSVWYGYYLNLAPGVGPGVDLAMDASNRPRMTFEDASQGLIYAYCTGSCESDSPAWQILLADSSADLDLSEPIPPIPPCAVAGWFTGQRTSLALDSAGNPRVVFDAEHWQGLNPITNPPGEPGCPGFRMDQINARFTIFNQP